MSVGPIGRSAETNLTAGDGGACTVFSYAHSKGLFVGISIQAGIITSRPDVNATFYGERIPPSDLLGGRHPRPEKADPLYRALAAVYQQPHFSSHPISPNTHAHGDYYYAQAVREGALFVEGPVQGRSSQATSGNWECRDVAVEDCRRARRRVMPSDQQSAEAVVQGPREVDLITAVSGGSFSVDCAQSTAVATPVTVATPDFDDRRQGGNAIVL